MFANSSVSNDEAVRRVRIHERRSDRAALLTTYVGDRQNRRHRPGRAFESTDYRFELVTDYGAFRDLQRHRLLTIEWQPLNVELGYDVPEVSPRGWPGRALRGVAGAFGGALPRDARGVPRAGQYAVALAFRIRYSMQMNAREAMHLIELRSGPQGHPSYRTGCPRDGAPDP